MVSLARAKTPFPARAVEPSKRAAIIDVPSLAPPRFSLPSLDPPEESRSKFVSVAARRGSTSPQESQDFSAVRRGYFLRFAGRVSAGGKTQSPGSAASREFTTETSRKRES